MEVREAVLRVPQVPCPLLRGHGAAAQVEPAHGCRQGQFADAQESPGWKQVGVAFSEEAQDPPNQEVQQQSEEDNLKPGNQNVHLVGLSFPGGGG